MVYASDQAHSSVPKAALLAGFGAEHLRLIETDDEHALRLDLLERAVEDDLAAGRRPCAVVAAVGTTATTALDPVAGIAALCARHDLWLHVDAALAGTAMICPEYRWMWEGVERADSVVFNPHKWMGTGFDLSAYYVRDPEHLVRVMSTDPSYLRTAQDGLVRNLRDWGIPLGRRFRALKLWFLLRAAGRRGAAGARAPRHRQRRLAGGPGGRGAGLGTHGAGAAPDRLPAARAAGAGRRRGGARGAQRRHRRRASTPAAATTSAPRVLKGRLIIRVSVGAQPTEREHVDRRVGGAAGGGRRRTDAACARDVAPSAARRDGTCRRRRRAMPR